MTSELDKLDEIIASIAKLAKEIYIIDECKTKQIFDHCENAIEIIYDLDVFECPTGRRILQRRRVFKPHELEALRFALRVVETYIQEHVDNNYCMTGYELGARNLLCELIELKVVQR